MRTAEDIVNEYQERGYDEFRIRAIAALRPEPMRGQIISLLNEISTVADSPDSIDVMTVTSTLETASTILEALSVTEEDTMAEPAASDIDTLSAEQAVIVEFQESDSLRKDDPVTGDDDPFWAEEESKGAEDEEFESVSILAAETAETLECQEAHLSLPGTPSPEEGPCSLSPVIESAESVAASNDDSVFSEESSESGTLRPEDKSTPARSEVDNEVAEGYVEELLNEVEAILMQSSRDGFVSDWDDADAIELDSLFDEPASPSQSARKERAPVAAANSASGPNVPFFHVLKHKVVLPEENEDSSQKEDDHRILYAFDNTSHLQAEEEYPVSGLHPEEKVDGKDWVDCGSGLILLPKAMNDAFTAYADAMRNEPIISSDGDFDRAVVVDEMMESVQEEGVVSDRLMADEEPFVSCDAPSSQGTSDYQLFLGMDRFLQQKPLNQTQDSESSEDEESVRDGESIQGLIWPKAERESWCVSTPVPLDVLSKSIEPVESDHNDDMTSELFAEEMQRLENHLSEIESSVTHKDHELDEMHKLLAAKDEIISLQLSQVEEGKNRQSELDAQILELSASGNRLRALAEEVAILKVNLADTERERNILKTEVIPGLEEQQLSLLEVMEEEVRQARLAGKTASRMRRRCYLSYSVASAASLLALLLPGMGFLQGDTNGVQATAAQQGITLISSTQETLKVGQLEKRVAQLESEKTALHQLNLKREAEGKRREGQLLANYSKLKESVAKDKLALASQLNRQQQASEQWTSPAPVIADRTPVHQEAVSPETVSAGSSRTPSVPVVRVVRKGDSFSRILREHYGSATREVQKQVAAANKLSNPNALYVGQKLQLVAIAPEDQ